VLEHSKCALNVAVLRFSDDYSPSQIRNLQEVLPRVRYIYLFGQGRGRRGTSDFDAAIETSIPRDPVLRSASKSLRTLPAAQYPDGQWIDIGTRNGRPPRSMRKRIQTPAMRADGLRPKSDQKPNTSKGSEGHRDLPHYLLARLARESGPTTVGAPTIHPTCRCCVGILLVVTPSLPTGLCAAYPEKGDGTRARCWRAGNLKHRWSTSSVFDALHDKRSTRSDPPRDSMNTASWQPSSLICL